MARKKNNLRKEIKIFFFGYFQFQVVQYNIIPNKVQGLKIRKIHADQIIHCAIGFGNEIHHNPAQIVAIVRLNNFIIIITMNSMKKKKWLRQRCL